MSPENDKYPDWDREWLGEWVRRGCTFDKVEQVRSFWKVAFALNC